MSINEPSTLIMICDDTLGGFTSIDSRRFGEEFIKRRRALKIDTGSSLSSLNSSAESLVTSPSDKFVTVTKKKKSKPQA